MNDTALQVIDDKDITIVQQSPMELAQSFLTSGGDIANLEKMLELEEKYEARQAKKAYTKAVADFKANPPKIIKDKRVDFTSQKGRTAYNHASLGNVTDTINKGLGEHGFSVAWPLEQNEGKIKVTCVITHEAGHSENTSLEAPFDNTGNKNGIQAMGSTVAYLQRYTVLSLTGLATHDQDDDGKRYPAKEKPISGKQVSQIVDMINETEADEMNFLKWIGAESVETIPAKLFGKAISGLKAKVKK